MAGDFSVVVHSYLDCINTLSLNSFLVDGKALERFFCTRFTEMDVIDGTTSQCLSEALDAVIGERPDAPVFVLTSCVTEMIGDEAAAVVRELRERTGARITLMRTSGLGAFTLAGIVDLLATSLVDLAPRGMRKKKGAINLIGSPPLAEFVEVFDKLGIEINRCIHDGSSLSDWLALPSASLNVVFDRSLFAGFLDKMEAEFAIPTLEVPPPYGVQASAEFYRSVAGHLQVPSARLRVIDELAGPGAALLEEGRDLFRSRKVGYNICSSIDFTMATNIGMGLVDLAMFEELGCDIEFLYQGDSSEENLQRVRDVLRNRGIEHSVHGFEDTFLLRPLLEEGRFDLVYCPRFLMGQVLGTGAKFLKIHTLQPGLRSMEANLELLRSALEGKN